VPPAQRPAATAARVLAGGILLACAAGLIGCGVPPELRNPPERAAPSPSPTPPASPTSAPAAAPPTTGTATPTFGELTAVDCQGNPTGNQVIALLRRSPRLLAPGVTASVRDRPKCAGTWQYTVIQVPGHEPLQVVSSGPANALTLVTAGTDVCSLPVRTGAPPGIRLIACDASS
jgi:hypothetical protein